MKKLYQAFIVFFIFLGLAIVSGEDFLSLFSEDLFTDSNEIEIPHQISEDGTYTSVEEVSQYLTEYGQLPHNYITKTAAYDLGWEPDEGNLDEVAPGKSIGGDRFFNREKQLPENTHRLYFEADIDYEGGFRNAKRLVYSNDGFIYYTMDHYDSFIEINVGDDA